jgi:hypothetical protein
MATVQLSFISFLSQDANIHILQVFIESVTPGVIKEEAAVYSTRV